MSVINFSPGAVGPFCVVSHSASQLTHGAGVAEDRVSMQVNPINFFTSPSLRVVKMSSTLTLPRHVAATRCEGGSYDYHSLQ